MSALNRLIDLLRPAPTPSPAYRDLLIGAGAGIAGTLLMGQYWVRVAPLLTPKPDKDEKDSSDDQKEQAPPADQNVISPLGQTHENGESSTAALGRHLYAAVTGKVPEAGTRQALSEAVHWATGIGGGAVCSAVLGQWKGHPLGPVTGLACGAAMWLLLDETVTPLLGLQDGPRSGDLSAHGNRLGAHLFFGLGLGLGAAALRDVLPE